MHTISDDPVTDVTSPYKLEGIIKEHLDIINRCVVTYRDGSEKRAVLSTLPESRYPYIYSRDTSALSQLLFHLCTGEFRCTDEAYRLLSGISRFMLSVQRKDGYWGQRYGIGGEEKSIYMQEDNIAHGMTTLGNYIIASIRRGQKVKELDAFIRAFNKGALYALKNYFRREINLFFSTTSIHESAIEKGYSLWVNFAYLRAFDQAEYIHNLRRRTEISGKVLDFKPYFERNINKLLIHNGRYIRRITPSGDYDYKPDVTLMSPFYFGFHNTNPEIMRNTVEFTANHLWDPELGMLQRYLPFTESIDTHIHSGNGPWLQYTAILARYYYIVGEAALADKIMAEIDRYKSPEGYIPEHLSTFKRFEEFMKLEWQTGLDFRKEFEKEILMPDITFDLILEELNNMKRSYDAILNEHSTKPDTPYIAFAAPLMWSHTEYLKAVLARHNELTRSSSSPSTR